MQHELGKFNVELNLAPNKLDGRVLHDSDRDLADVLDGCRARIERLGARLVAVGMYCRAESGPSALLSVSLSTGSGCRVQ